MTDSKSLHSLALIWVEGVTEDALVLLRDVPLEDLDLYGCRGLQLSEPGRLLASRKVRMRLPDGSYYVKQADGRSDK